MTREIDSSERARERLLCLLRERSYARKRVVLASGKESDFFIDCKQTVLLAEGHVLAALCLLEEIRRLPERPRAVAAVELGGCPLASAVSALSFERGEPLDAVYVRKGKKSHGSSRILEGDDKLEVGAPIVLLEDVATTGGSSAEAVQKLRDRGLRVISVIALVDRNEGAREKLSEIQVPLRALFERSDFMGAT